MLHVMEKYYLYRHFSADKVLLYVGITSDLKKRKYQHAQESPWFSEINRIESVAFDTRDQAQKAEAIAILDEFPVHNFESQAKSNRSPAHRKREERKRKRALGLVPSEIWARPELLADIHSYVRAKNEEIK